MTRRTHNEQAIEQVAGIICECGYDAADAERVNFEGWTFEVRWDDGGYISSDDYTLVEGWSLNNADLRRAFRTAQEWWDEAGLEHDDLIEVNDQPLPAR